METKQDLLDWLVNECEYTREEVESMDNYELAKAGLEYEGFRNYTDFILTIIKCAYEEELEGIEFL